MRYRNAIWVSAAMLAGAVAGSLIGPQPAQGVAKEIVEIQNDVTLLLQGQRDMQNSMSQNQGVVKTMLQQSIDSATGLNTSMTDSVNKLSTSMGALQKSVQDVQANSGARLDTLSTSVQGLSDNLDEVRARIGKVNQQLVDLQNSVQSLDAKLAAAAPATSASVAGATDANSTRPAPPPSADVLYSNGLRDITSGHYDLASQEFQDYLKYYSGTELASNAQFYLGEIAFMQKNYRQAAGEYDKVLQNYPNSFKVTSAHLGKGLALLALGQKDAGIRELREVIRNYPGTDEAKLARARLRQIGASNSSAPH
ncbi:MAG: tol-pal system protein YbgF [Candidatus Acidiferrum sp.]